ncbi:tetratricopeptide repeat-containing sensor histidine kinase [Pedobacter duraquae]|uniref:histidine kinase n=1 Tax=Pedobacter duraquae TaxID=425511 RepID=A0A4R6IK40_9SPHI|nr:histidine kinase dimerization/phosphoacceptor domain -containing protein [Pedobacter duraquae]TDO22381.1 two-component sensor histidine kinase [Pedobacter duraquae]
MRRAAAFIIFLTLSFNVSKSQPHKAGDIQFLQTRLSDKLTDTTRFTLLQQISRHYLLQFRNKGIDSAKIFLVRATNILDKHPGYRGKYKIDNLLLWSELANKQKNILLTKKLLREAIELEKLHGDLRNEARLWEQLGLSMSWEESWAPYIAEMTTAFGNAYTLYRKTGNIDKQFEMRYRLSTVMQSHGYIDDADKACLTLLSEYKNVSASYLPDAYLLLSSSNRYKGNFNKSLFYSLKGLAAMKQIGDSSHASKVYGELAQVYQELGQPAKSIVWYRKTLALREKMDLPQRYLFRTAGFLAHELILEKQPQQALQEILALEHRNKPETQFDIATLSQIKAYCYEAMGNAKLAEYHYRNMLRLADNKTIAEFIIFGKYDLANFYVNQQRYKDAAPFLPVLLNTPASASREKDIQLLAFKVDSAAGQYFKAIQHIRRYEQLKDSIFSSTKSKQIEELQIQYETAKNEQSIKSLKKDSLLNVSRVKEANNIRNMTSLGLLVLALFLTLLYLSYRAKQRNNKEINKKNLWLNQLVDEKEWLIKEVHHRVKNNLQIVMGLLQRQSAYIDNEKALVAIQNSEHRMQSIALIHQKLYQSESMALINMPEYIDELVTYLKDSFDIGSRIHFYKEIENFSLDVQHAVPLGLILNEAITNAIKYAFDKTEEGNIYIAIFSEDDENFVLQIRDDGHGFPDNFSLKTVNSLGMNLMRGLSKQLGGKLEIHSQSGAVVHIRFKKNKLISTKNNKQKERYA